MSAEFDVVALGELLVDFTAHGQTSLGDPLFEANPGGAPCNVLAMLKKLGRACAFVGKVGDDLFGRHLRSVVEETGIDLTYLAADPAAHTTLAFVQTFPNGDRDFSFYRDPGADMLLTEEEVPADTVARCRIFHFGSLSMTHPGVRAATKKAVACAKAGGAYVSFDPNLRPPLWSSLEEARDQIAWGLGQCDVLKIADNELEFMTGQTDFDLGAAILRQRYPNIRLLCVTAGAEGSYAYYDQERVFVPAFRLGGTIETTGAGDTFCACVLDGVLRNGLERLTAQELTAMLRFANAAAYLVTTRRGALRSMPEKRQVLDLLRQNA